MEDNIKLYVKEAWHAAVDQIQSVQSMKINPFGLIKW
jgi:hypothetical protein